MSNRMKAKGTIYESSLLPLLRYFYPEARRAPLAGIYDIGDFILPGEKRFALQAKNRKTMAMAEWLRAATAQAGNLDGNAVGVVVHKRHGVTEPAEQYVTLTLRDFLLLVNGRPDQMELIAS